MRLALSHYKRKSVYAYLCPIQIEKGQIIRGNFYNGEPKDDEDNKDRYYRGRSSVVEFDLDKFEDGLYEYKESGGENRVRFGYLKIEAGEITDEWFSKDELLNAVNPLPQLPELEGASQRQIKYAIALREKLIRAKRVDEHTVQTKTKSRFWIDLYKESEQ